MLGPPDNNIEGPSLGWCELMQFCGEYSIPAQTFPGTLAQAVCPVQAYDPALINLLMQHGLK